MMSLSITPLCRIMSSKEFMNYSSVFIPYILPICVCFTIKSILCVSTVYGWGVIINDIRGYIFMATWYVECSKRRTEIHGEVSTHRCSDILSGSITCIFNSFNRFLSKVWYIFFVVRLIWSSFL